MGKTILVTGGAGFVGSHLCERLVADGHTVISLDNYFTGTTDNHVAGVEYRTGHTKDVALLVQEKVDVIYHLGEYSRVHASLDEPNIVWDFNTVGTLAVLEYWRERGCKLVYAASSTKNENSHTTNTHDETRSISPYTFSKAANADLVCNYGKWYSLPYAVVYFYNVYGPRERAWDDYGTLIETFRQNFLHGIPYIVNAPGTQTRAFTHVFDTVAGIVCAGELGAGDGHNICANDVHSIMSVAEMFGGEIELHPQTKTSRSSSASDTSKIETLGWKQQHWLKDYIEAEKKKKA